ncbi:MAG: filamentous hemagglutinin N-terminal domain-containing protein [Oscillatoriales cyanobacterium C42_A2020_001]|nr:filamentous hemagglutinin N-terminal domain-containing protein [Leptolyngbyaceae cyanobacterium C42_A2020_001]
MASWMWAISGVASLAVHPTFAIAQIIPDATLPVNSIVTPGCTVCVIDGGTTRGTNVFHSLREFSVPTGGVAWFNNAPQVQTILARVTGNSVSTIDGLIRANGTANLFLLNPNGIIFGTNAQLNIGGSFLATTANSFQFSDGSEFSATNPSTSPLLSVNVPVGLQFGQAPGEIVNRSRVSIPGIAQPVGLAVQPGRTLALVGGDVTLENGNVTAFAGRVELGSVQKQGIVSLTPISQGVALAYAGESFGTIRLIGGEVETSGNPGGAIQIQGRSLRLTDNFRIASFNLGAQPGGNILINATDSLELVGRSDYVEVLQALTGGTLNPGVVRNIISSLTLGSGTAGNIVINTGNLTMREGGYIASTTAGSGRAGDLIINASELVDLSESGLFNGTFVGSRGDSGALTINTRTLIARNNGQISNATYGFGKGGSLTVNASESLQLMGSQPIPAPALNNDFVTGIFTNASVTGNGEAGNLTLLTKNLTLTQGARISADSNSPKGLGGGGNVTVRASESIQLSGTSPGTGKPTSISAFGIRQGGNVELTTQTFTAQDGAGVSVLSPGNAGNLELVANSILLSDRAFLEATSLLGEGGNLRIQTHTLQLRQNSRINTSAGLTGGNGSGGNIRITADFIIGVLAENSDISANAFAGSGGRVDITAKGIYGLKFQLKDSPFSDITASSQFGVNGTVTINSLNIDPNRGLIDLPANLVDPSNQIVQGCNPDQQTTQQSNRFIITERGGLPAQPEETFSGSDRPLVTLTELVGEAEARSREDFRLEELRGRSQEGGARRGDEGVREWGSEISSTHPSTHSSIFNPQSPIASLSPAPLSPLPDSPSPLTEAQGWAIAPDGSIYLVVNAANVTPNSRQPEWNCPNQL